MTTSKVSAAHQSGLGVRASSLFWPWFVGNITVLPFVVGLWVADQGLNAEDAVYVALGGVSISAVVLGLFAGLWPSRSGLDDSSTGVPSVVLCERCRARPATLCEQCAARSDGGDAGGPVTDAVPPPEPGWLVRSVKTVGRGVVSITRTLVLLAEVVVLAVVGWTVLWWWFMQPTGGWLNRWWVASIVVVLGAVAVWSRYRSRSGDQVQDQRVRAHQASVSGIFLVVTLVGATVVAVRGAAEVDPSPGSGVPVRLLLVVAGICVAPWLLWASDYSRHVVKTERGLPVTWWVAVASFLPTAALMVAGVLVSSHDSSKVGLSWSGWGSFDGAVGLFGLFDAVTGPWRLAVLIPLTIGVLAALVVRVGDDWEAVLVAWAPRRRTPERT
ncbi:MAG: hypothetical protein FWH11_04770 [Micrococcales bacterium]|nr:hypothetical protein [Micrococcales bacterium]